MKKIMSHYATLCLMFRSPSPPFVADLPTANPPPSSTGRDAGARVPRRGGGVLQRPIRQRMRQRPRRRPGSLGSLGRNEGFLGIFWHFLAFFGIFWESLGIFGFFLGFFRFFWFQYWEKGDLMYLESIGLAPKSGDFWKSPILFFKFWVGHSSDGGMIWQ